MKYSDISKKYLMYITRHKYSKTAFRSGLEDGFHDPTRIEVKSLKNVEENSASGLGKQVPTIVTLYIKFYQINQTD